MAPSGYLLQGGMLHDGSLVDVLVQGATIASVVPTGQLGVGDETMRVVPAHGKLLLPAFVDLHIHLDKAFVKGDLPPHDGSLRGAIEGMRDRKRRYSPEDVAERAVRLIRSSVAAGTTRIRSHVDVDRAAGLRALEGVRAAAEECRDIADVQLVVFPQEGLIRDPSAKQLLERAVEMGVDAVGGMPHWERGIGDQLAHVDFCFGLAAEAGLDVDMHVDETDDASVRTLEMVVDATLRRGFEGRVTVGHVCSLAGVEHEHAERIIARCAEARMTVVSNPATNLVLQGRGDRGLIRRGLTRVGEFRAAGVNLCFGQDNVTDGFYPFGRGDMLEIAFLAAHAAHLTGPADLRYLLGSVTEAPARAWGTEGYGLRPGGRADLSVFHAAGWEQALRLQRPPGLVFHRGRLVARTAVVTEVGALSLEDG